MNTKAAPPQIFRVEGVPAPGDLVILHGFLNTRSIELGVDDFASAAQMTDWLRTAGLWQIRSQLQESEFQQLLVFRETIREVLQGSRENGSLLALSANIQFGFTMNNNHLQLKPSTRSSEERVRGSLLAIIYNSIKDGTWPRFKCCALPSCGWAYYDNTRSRTKKWCSMKTCGSRHKAREYYKRNR